MRTWRWNAGVLAAVVGLAVLVAQLPMPTAAAKKAELSIGFISALSGPGIGWGMGMLGGLEMAAEDVNKAGGIQVGDTTYTVKVIAYDDKYTGPGAVQAAQRLISQDGVNVIVGPLGSVPMLAIADVTESNKVLVLSNSYTTKALSAKKPYTFRLSPTTAEFSTPLIGWIAKNRPQLKTAAILSPNDESGKEVMSHNVKGYEKAGLKVVIREFYERGTQDFVPLLTKVVAAKPDIIDFDGSTPVDSGVILKQARQLGYAGQFLKGGGPGTQEIIRVAGDHAEGLLYYSPWDPNDPKIKGLMERFEAKYKMPFNPLGIFFYEGGHMLFQTMKQAQTVAPDGLRQALERQTEYKGLLGRYLWGGESDYGIRHQWIAPFFVGQVQRGKEVMLTKIEP
jgi:branched-chain amino acid transport system substrate-binding protein